MFKRKNQSLQVRFHICDHSNAPYLKHLPTNRTAITCHDVLAIRGALGYEDAFVSASSFGKKFQKWILHYLSKARLVACVSENTLLQLKELTDNRIKNQKGWKVIYNSFNASFNRLDPIEASAILRKAGITDQPFILHVGSGLPRKNRKLLIEMIFNLGDKWNGYICFAGDALDKPLLQTAERLGLSHRIISIVKPDHRILEALYSNCEAFIFPSFSEGFGWPLIEAQACGAPVIASDINPLLEVSGGSALHVNPNKTERFCESIS